MSKHAEALERAKALIEERKPEASPQKKAAFANSVAYLVPVGRAAMVDPVCASTPRPTVFWGWPVGFRLTKQYEC